MSDYVLDYLELPSADNDKSRGFFSKAFGWTFVDYGGSYAEIRGAGLLFGVNSDEADKSAAAIPVIRTADIEKAVKDVIAAGGVITRPTYEYPGGLRFFFCEPGGNECAVYMPRD